MSTPLPFNATDRELLNTFRFIPWWEPQSITTPDAQGLGCRFCIARHGLRAEDVGNLPQTREEWEAHMREHHG